MGIIGKVAVGIQIVLFLIVATLFCLGEASIGNVLFIAANLVVCVIIDMRARHGW